VSVHPTDTNVRLLIANTRTIAIPFIQDRCNIGHLLHYLFVLSHLSVRHAPLTVANPGLPVGRTAQGCL